MAYGQVRPPAQQDMMRASLRAKAVVASLLLKTVRAADVLVLHLRCLCLPACLGLNAFALLPAVALRPLQTGAGKTYSLSSIAADAIGMIPRAAAEIFSHIEGDPAHEYTVYMSYVQLYMELIQVGPVREGGSNRRYALPTLGALSTPGRQWCDRAGCGGRQDTSRSSVGASAQIWHPGTMREKGRQAGQRRRRSLHFCSGVGT